MIMGIYLVIGALVGQSPHRSDNACGWVTAYNAFIEIGIGLAMHFMGETPFWVDVGVFTYIIVQILEFVKALKYVLECPDGLWYNGSVEN